jgi:TonB family protein
VAKRTNDKGEWLDLEASGASDVNGSPVVNENGVIVGIVTTDRGKTPAANSVLSSNSLQSFLGKIESNAAPKWAAAPPTPTPSPKMRKGKIVFNPAPTFPSNFRSSTPIRGLGTYRILFDTAGNAKNVQILRSTGAPALDQAAVSALIQWKSDPGAEWSMVVPVNFQPQR